MKPFRVGDNILTQGQEGTVSEIRIFHTIIITYDNRRVVVPNSKLSNEVIINLSGSGNRRLDIEMKFGNAIDYEQVKASIDEAIADAGTILDDPPRRIGISSLEADGYKVMLNLWIDAHGFVDTKMTFQEILLQRLKGSGLKLPGMA
ncbi:mechanosensitive ion channel family protein [Niabella hibiscisoli]|uniref:mechanosensitive ion channel family protein n=1 Tax=Niabella hibiscisoli TaxID=1825928 RepID=UPI001F0F53A1|nr:mechanosensitive ion channel family protein [Niabella hibiscisoli]MCH5718770.1 mechanosensitive ion channel family protein [Niabella hibiscisoli]